MNHIAPNRSSTTASAETILTNARIVLPDQVIDGSVVMRGDAIAEVQPGRSAAAGAIDLEGDLLLPGLVDVHTDNLERQVQPRITARWPSRSAMMAHDAQCAAAGVTTVLDALCLGDLGFEAGRIQTFRDGVVDGDALAGTGLLRADHFLHLRCELPAPDVLEMLEAVARHPRVRMVSLMDHTPGVGQYSEVESYRALRIKEGHALSEIDDTIALCQSMRARHLAPNRAGLLARFAGTGVALASHDDRTEAEVAQNHADGIGISEFPVSLEAAQAAHRCGMQVIAGAPNLVRGGSHSGNVAVAELLRAGLVDVLASDYVPTAMLEAAFHATLHGLSWPQAAALVCEHPARMAGLADRGRIAAGLRADLVQVRLLPDIPVVRQVWRSGSRVA